MIISGRYDKEIPYGYKGFAAKLPMAIDYVNCKGKFIYFQMANPELSIWSTLGMTGGWSKTASAHTRIMFVFNDGSKIYFNDQRNFGTIKFVDGVDQLKSKLRKIGPDMLTEELSNEKFRKILTKHGRKTLAEILMSQDIISGVGNYLKAEVLYLSRLSPHRMGGSLSNEEVDNLNQIIQKTIRDSYASGGSTLQTYVDMYGNTGDFNPRLIYGLGEGDVCGGFAVYKRTTDPLGNKVISEETKDKRTSWWVPSIQK
jgi:formamidopyrimidine-DNA glycosylase